MSQLIALAHPSPPPLHVGLLMVSLACLLLLAAILIVDATRGD